MIAVIVLGCDDAAMGGALAVQSFKITAVMCNDDATETVGTR
jgi:hypothetical protein